MIMNRRVFEYSLSHVFRYYLRCYACRSKKTLRSAEDGKRDLYFEKASRSLAKHMDIGTLLRTIRNAE